MGYAPRYVKRARHQRNMKLWATMSLLGWRLSPWQLTHVVVYEIVTPSGEVLHYAGRNALTSMRHAAKIEGIEY